MKRLSFLILAILTGSTTCLAQIEDDGAEDAAIVQRQAKTNSTTTKSSASKFEKKHYKYEFSVGPRIGLGFSTLSEGNGLEIADGSGTGFVAGLGLNVRLGDKDKRNRPLDGQGAIGFGLELNYVSHAAKTLAGDDLKMSYFEVPVLFQWYPLYGSRQLNNLYLEAGPTIAGTLSSDPEILKYNNIAYKTGDLKGFDVKMTVGLGYRFSKNAASSGFYGNARYYLGTSDLAGNFPAKFNAFELSVGYLFKCIGTKK